MKNNNSVPVFVALGVILLILVGVGVYMSTTNPDGVKGVVEDTIAPDPTTQTNTNTTSGDVVSGGFELSPAQVDALVTLGIDPADVPSTITAEQEACFVAALGEERVVEIKGGDVPNPVEFLKAKSCI